MPAATEVEDVRPERIIAKDGATAGFERIITNEISSVTPSQKGTLVYEEISV